MATRDRSRTLVVGAAVAALLAPLAIVASLVSPASAAQMKQHEVYMYKVEKHVDLAGEFPDQNMHEHVYCDPGDIALDGMWRVDNVEQANPPETYGDERDVSFLASYGDSVDLTEWHFRATNFADGIAQIKLFVTCIRGHVEPAFLHAHSVRVSGQYFHNAPGLLAGANTIAPASQCAADEYVVAPGFNVYSATHEKRLRLYKSWPNADYRGWEWRFILTDPVDIQVTYRCLKKTTSGNGNGNHAHAIPMEWRPDFAGASSHLNVFRTQERRLNCDDGANGQHKQNYKLMVAGFWIIDPGFVWYLGMDPRPKQRAFKYWYEAGGTEVRHIGLCVRARTGKQIRFVP